MQTKRFILVVAILMGVLTCAADRAWCTPDMISCGVLLEPKDSPTGPGPMTLNLQIRMELSFDSIVVKVETFGKLIYSGPTTWIVQNEGVDTFWYELEVIVPPNDTSGIKVDFGCNADAEYFVTTGDTIEIYHSWPQPPQPKGGITIARSTGGHAVHGPSSPPGEQESQKPVIKMMRPDSTEDDSKLIGKPSGQVERLTDDRQISSESAGRKVVDSAGWSTIDGLKEAAQKDIEKERDKTRELIVDLRKPEDYNYVRTLVKDLTPCDTAGYYRVKLTHAQANDVHNRGISITSARPPRGPHPAPKGKR